MGNTALSSRRNGLTQACDQRSIFSFDTFVEPPMPVSATLGNRPGTLARGAAIMFAGISDGYSCVDTARMLRVALSTTAQLASGVQREVVH